jgi:hypothetical protein
VKLVRDLLRKVLASPGEIRRIAIVYELRGQKPKSYHNFETNAQAVTFVNEVLRLSDDELLQVLRARF